MRDEVVLRVKTCAERDPRRKLIARASFSCHVGASSVLSESMPRGLIALVLHAHLPYVRHVERHVPEERWLFEAITECYLPIVALLMRLFDEGLQARITLSVSPTVASMLRDSLLKERYVRHLDQLTALLDREALRSQHDPETAPVVALYQTRTSQARQIWDALEGDVVGALASLEDAGVIELVTTAATHAYLPLLRPRAFIAAQIALGLEHHEQLFGRRPKGFWLPECGYEAGVEEVLSDLGISYTFVESQSLLNGDPAAERGVHAPVLCPGEKVVCFARDPESSSQVWSAIDGYPADVAYREFFRDIASERTAEELGEYFAPLTPSAPSTPFTPLAPPTRFETDRIESQPGNVHRGLPTGLKYHRITGPTERKALYEPRVADARAREHADLFVKARQAQVERIPTTSDQPPLVVAPFDAELFGHWWFEGPLFLENVIRRLARSPNDLEMVTPSEFLSRWPTAQVLRPAASSWGEGGSSEVWLNDRNAWVQRHLHAVGTRALNAIAERATGPEGLLRRAAEQALKELLLAQASDWPFLIRAGTSAVYAEDRLRTHLSQAWALLDQIESGEVDEPGLARLESMNSVFTGVDILSSVWCSVREGGEEEKRCSRVY